MRIGLNWAEFLLLLLTGWTLIGLVGIALSFRRGERAKARKNLFWIFGVWGLYLAVLLTLSLTAHPRKLAQGQKQCFGSLCYTVIQTDVVPGYLVQNGDRVLRVSVRIDNPSREHRLSDHRLSAYLLDSQNRRWHEIPGLQGIPLTSEVAPGGSVLSQPVFKIPVDVAGLQLVLTHGHGLPYALMLGDRDSLLHPPVLAELHP